MPPTEVPGGGTRRTPAALLVAAAILLALRIAVTIHEEDRPAQSANELQWVPFSDAIAVSRASGRPILYEFGAEWCGPCQQLRRDVFAQATPARRLQAMVVPVALVDRQQEDGHNAPVVDSLERAYRVDGFPTLVIYSPESGRSLVRSGYAGADGTLRWVAQGVVQVRMAASSLAAPNP